MKLQTEVEILPMENRFDYGDKLFAIGSCFAAEVGERLKELRFDIVINPFGTLFNPASIATALERVVSNTPFREEELFLQGEIYKSFELGSGFGEMEKSLLLKRANEALELAHNHFMESSVILITLGSSWIYKERSSGRVVANCHKERSDRFERHLLTAQESVELLSPLIERAPQKRWIFTVSPVRHFKDGARANQVSKSYLHIVTALLEERFPNSVSYFPSYEIVMDQLRDYRFFGEDLLHPSKGAVEFITSQFCKFAIAPHCSEKMEIIRKIERMRGHRPLFPQSKEYQKFIAKIEQLEQLLLKIPRNGPEM